LKKKMKEVKGKMDEKKRNIKELEEEKKKI
jgi:hypothetical protein